MFSFDSRARQKEGLCLSISVLLTYLIFGPLWQLQPISQKKCRLVCVKQGLDVDPNNQHEMTTKVLLTVFSMMAELERDFISERTREGLRVRKERGIVLGKPK